MATPTSNGNAATAPLTGWSLADSVLSGYKWATGTLSFSFGESNSQWSTSSSTGYGSTLGDGEPWSTGYQPLSDSDRGYVRSALGAWAEVANLTFVETAETSSRVGDLRFAYTRLPIEVEAQAYYPSRTAYAGDVWFNIDGTPGREYWTPGSFSYLAALHEIGHALGLKHPFEGEPLSPDTLPLLLDSHSYTVMSYAGAFGDNTTSFSYEPTTPMVLDIVAIQHLYGANTKTNAGNTQYVFEQGKQYHQTIWDAGGTDTLVYASREGGTLDLTEGIGGGSELGQPLWLFGSGGDKLLEMPDVWIAYGAVIENATGGAGNDTIIGNSAANLLQGGSGSDTISAGKGRDTLQGGRGSDQLKGGSGADVFVLNTLSGSDRVSDFRSGTDRLRIDLDVGDGDGRIDGAVTRGSAGGYSARAELVVITKNSAELGAASASKAIGAATGAYHAGDTALFAIDTGKSSALYLFTSADADARVEASELHLLATLAGTPATALGDYLFG